MASPMKDKEAHEPYGYIIAQGQTSLSFPSTIAKSNILKSMWARKVVAKEITAQTV